MSFTVLLLVVLWGAPLALLGVSLTGAKAEQRSSTSGTTVAIVRVGSRQFDGRQSVTVTAHMSRVPAASAGVAGTVTALRIGAGDNVEDGSELFAVDGRMLLAFSQNVPLFRELRMGDSGDDVAALGRFLNARHLLESPADSRFGPKMRVAVAAYQARYGYDQDGVFRPSYVVFIPHDFGPVTEVSALIGERVTDQAAVIKGTSRPTSLRLEPSKKDPSPVAETTTGAVLRIGSEQIAISARVPSTQELPAIWASLTAGVARGELKQSTVATDSSTEIQFEGAQIAQTSNSTAGSVPSSALFTAADGTSCLFESGSASRWMEKGTTAHIVQAKPDSGEIGHTLIDSRLIGIHVARDPSRLDPKILARCKS
ncbi:peptidoglycan-binding domain-containing protein [Leifsonia sp. 2MCAF36]|uniref:peptidoglycan-binding domain-containing protein n=1 Tax=Leifsonia sp. 2MCAF36 TaxID=3232988 RepID=UPI003F9C4F7A